MVSKSVVGFILILFSISVFLVFPASTGLSNCLSEATGELKTLPTLQQTDKDAFCKSSQKNINNLNSCFTQVKNKNPLASLFLRTKKESLNKSVEMHNKTCPEYTASIDYN